VTSIAYQALARVVVEHERYRDGDGTLRRRGADLAWSISDDTAQLLRDLGILARSSADGFALLAELDESGALKRGLPAHASILVQLRATDVDLERYSALPLNRPRDRVYLLTNRGRTSPERSLSTGAVVSELDLVTVRAAQFELTLGSGPAQVVRVLDARQRPVVSVRSRQIDGHQRVQLDLRGQPESVYTLVREGAEDERFVLLSQRPALAVVLLQSGDELAQAYRLLDDAQRPLGTVFTMRFAQRRARWRYLVAFKRRPRAIAEDLTLYDGEQPFARGPAQSRPGIGECVPFESAGDYAFATQAHAGVRLVHSVGGVVQFELDNLPNPSVGSVRDEAGGTFAEAFVYI
jgi:hypothetical protein